MKKILITGGTGFVGTHLKNLLLKVEPQAQLHLTSLTATKGSEPQVQVHALDLCQGAKLKALIKKIQPEEIYHLASLANVGASFQNPAATLKNNFDLTLNLLETVRECAPKTRLLLISSADIYAPSEQPLTERSPLAPGSPYGASKALQDILGQNYACSFGLKIIIARPFNHIGPGQQRGFVVADFASQIAALEARGAAKARLMVGNLNCARDFTAVGDMVRAYHLLMRSGQSGEIYNLGSGQAVTIKYLLERLLTFARLPIAVKVDPKKFRPVDVPLIVADPQKIRALGWRSEIALDQVLEEILNYWRGIIEDGTLQF